MKKLYTPSQKAAYNGRPKLDKLIRSLFRV